MKQLMILSLLITPLFLLAQRGGDLEKLTPKQQATLHAKKMSINLDLSDAQEQKVRKVFEKHFASIPRNPENIRYMSSDDRYNLRLQRLEQVSALQKKMKTVLSEKQYGEWRENCGQMCFLRQKLRKEEFYGECDSN